MRSPLEDNPKILEKTGLFIVLFSQIETMLGLQFYFMIDQQNDNQRNVLDYLSTQDVSKKIDLLKPILGDDQYEKVKTLNIFRNFIAHGLFGIDSAGNISVTKQKRNTRKYDSMKLDHATLDMYIKEERDVMVSIHGLVLKKSSEKHDKAITK